MVEAREELLGILQNDEMRNVPIVVVANKQDLPSKIYFVYLSKYVFQKTGQLMKKVSRSIFRLLKFPLKYLRSL